MKIIRTVRELREAVADARSNDRTVGLVPTMGALHAGHLSLVGRSVRENGFTVVSVFVNPTQFNNPDDLRTYPRTEEADCRLLESAGVDVAFIPSVEEMYPEPDNRVFDLGPVAEVMEGAMRPGHFQQIAVIRRMVEIEKIPVEIVDCPICREADGLALSSRNVRLTPEQRAIAPAIHRTLAGSLEYAADGHSLSDTIRYVTDTINSFPGMEVEYYEIVDPLTMQPLKEWPKGKESVGCVTVWCGDVRLIDNIKYAAPRS